MGEPREWGRRGQSSVLGVVLILAIVIAGSTLTIALGAEAFASTNNHLTSSRAEQSMTQLDSQIAMVGLGSSNLQQVELAGSSSQYVVENNSGMMTVSYENLTSTDETTIFKQEMGAIVYENGETDIAYQGGGVWRLSEGGGATMISPPEFHYREATLTLPLVTVSGDRSLASSAVVRPNNSTRYFPNESIDGNFTNPLEGSRVQVTVQSRFYEAWGQYFEQRTDGQVSYDHPNQTVTIDLVAPVDRPRVDSASSSLSASGTFELQGSSKTACSPTGAFTDSYNSSDTPNGYCAQPSSNIGAEGDIVYGKDVDINSGTGTDNIRGDVVSGSVVTVSASNGNGQVDVYGNINYTDSCQASNGNGNGNGNGGGNNQASCGDRIVSGSGGSVNQIDGIETTPALTPTVVQKVQYLSNGGNNSNGAETDVIDSNEIDFTGTEEIEAGSYYFDDLVLDGSSQTLELDTSGGDITIAVNGEIDIDSGNKIRVTGDGTVRVYAIGAGGQPNDLELGSSAQITNAGDDAPQFRLYGPANYTAQIGDGGGNTNLAKFVGVIYAPPGTTDPSNAGNVAVYGGEIYGGVVTGTTTVDKGSIHYDEALGQEEMVSGQNNVVRVTYLHVSTNEVIVESG
jgi:flagellin-like protein